MLIGGCEIGMGGLGRGDWWGGGAGETVGELGGQGMRQGTEGSVVWWCWEGLGGLEREMG